MVFVVQSIKRTETKVAEGVKSKKYVVKAVDLDSEDTIVRTTETEPEEAIGDEFKWEADLSQQKLKKQGS